jgi:putative tryptophan/tyrosine transport system substrate-binding protein
VNGFSVTPRGLALAVLIGAVHAHSSVHADSPQAIPRIGMLLPQLADAPLGDGLREGLRELGYIEGKTFVLESRPPGSTPEALRSLAADLAHSKVDLIVVFSTPASRAALDATTLPIVFLAGDPVASGLAASLARPGGNATGVSLVTTELTAKRLELLRLSAPKARRFILLTNSANPTTALQLEAAQERARTLGVQLIPLDARNASELDAALARIAQSGAGGVVVSAELLFLGNRAKIARTLRETRLPAIFPATEYHDAGVLMSYGPSLKQAMRRVAVYVDKILRGARPSDLPIEQVSKVELVIDLRVARAQDLEIPQDLLLRADEVIR